MLYVMTTWGKWESIRQELKNVLLTNQLIQHDETSLDNWLLTIVATEMINSFFSYTKQHSAMWVTSPRQLLLAAYDQSLNVLVSMIQPRFSLTSEQIEQFINPLIKKALAIDEQVIEPLLTIGKTQATERIRLINLYFGNDFSQLYPELFYELMGANKQLLTLSEQHCAAIVDEEISKENDQTAVMLRQHVLYLGEITAQQKDSVDVAQRFQQQTGKTVHDYTLNILAENTHQATYKMTTWGKWETIRQELKQSLLSTPALACIEESLLDRLLLTTIVSQMIKAAFAYTSQNMAKWNNSESSRQALVLASYDASWQALTASLTETLVLFTDQVDQYVANLRTKADDIDQRLIKDILAVGAVSSLEKNTLRDQLYGANFKELYPNLANNIILNDTQIIDQAKQKVFAFIEQKINDCPETAALLKQQLTFLEEIALQRKSDVDFSERFKHETGKSMEQYKEDYLDEQRFTKDEPVEESTRCSI